MLENIHNNDQILQQIEWNEIIKKLKDLGHFEITSRNILVYQANKGDIEHILNQTQEFCEYLYSNDFISFINEINEIDPEFDAAPKIVQISKESALNLKDINEFAKFCETFINNYQVIKHYFPAWLDELNFNEFKRSFTKQFLSSFRRYVSRDGEISLDKHPVIAPLYHRQLTLEGQIRTKLGDIIKSGDIQNKLQFSSYDLINDRYVIPIRSDSFTSKLGQIISRSDSGNTLFVEPPAISQLNYQRLQVVVEIQSILAKIELELTLILKGHLAAISFITRKFYQIDSLVTRAKFATFYNLTYPILKDIKGIKLRNSFHPLIPNPVKNDIEITDTHGGLIISGPNTGGKTATLKTLALTQLFLHYGLFIPCDYGEVFLYERIFYFGNDNQDLSNGLSSFSAEVKNYTSLFENLGDSNLILIDEIFNSTSSEEASALAVAFFKKLHLVASAHLIISSHHQTLKTILHQDKFYISAHMGFNIESNEPTYKLHYGSPGSSHALRIFNSMTKAHPLFENVYTNALQFLDNKAIHYEKLLESIARKEHLLEKTLSENTQINKQLMNQKKSMEGIISLKIKDRVEKTEIKLKKVIEKAETILSETKKGSINKLKQIDKARHSIHAELREINPRPTDTTTQEHSNLSIPVEFIPGNQYFCMSLNKTVVLKRLEKNLKGAQVSIGNMHMKVPTNTLRVANETNKNRTNDSNLKPVTIITDRNARIEYDCRGMRLEEFESLVEDAIGDLLLGEMPFVNFIHGHGTGVLKSWLRKYAKSHRDIQVIPNDTGNDGETRIALQ